MLLDFKTLSLVGFIKTFLLNTNDSNNVFLQWLILELFKTKIIFSLTAILKWKQKILQFSRNWSYTYENTPPKNIEFRELFVLNLFIK